MNCRSAITRGLTGKFVDGWSVSGVTTIQDGAPVVITRSRGGRRLRAFAGTFFGTNMPGDGTG